MIFTFNLRFPSLCLSALGVFFSTISLAQDASSIAVYTAREIVTLDPIRPVVEAVAVKDDRIVAAGSLEEIQQSLSGQAFTIDTRFDNLVLIPGLINQHEHAWLASLLFMTEILSIEDWVLPEKTVSRVSNAAEYRERLEKIVEQHTDSSEVLYTWGFHQLFHGELTRADLDEISDTIPIVVLQRSLHEQIHITLALEYFSSD